MGMGLGAVFANQLVKWDVKLKEDLDVMLAKARAANERRYFGILSSFLFFLVYQLLKFCFVFYFVAVWRKKRTILAYEMVTMVIEFFGNET